MAVSGLIVSGTSQDLCSECFISGTAGRGECGTEWLGLSCSQGCKGTSALQCSQASREDAPDRILPSVWSRLPGVRFLRGDQLSACGVVTGVGGSQCWGWTPGFCSDCEPGWLWDLWGDEGPPLHASLHPYAVPLETFLETGELMSNI